MYIVKDNNIDNNICFDFSDLVRRSHTELNGGE
jgi:hypothetical protein